MKVHHYLSSLGVINLHSRSALAYHTTNERHMFKKNSKNKKELLAFELEVPLGSPGLGTDHNRLLKRLTAELRPYCDYCRLHCGLVWFQHNRSLDPKEIANIMKNVNSKNPPLSQREYEYVLCVRCYCENHFPLLLTHHDFKKVGVNDRLEPNRRKRNKRRRKEKRKREVEEDPEEEQKDREEEERSHAAEEEEAEKKEEVASNIQRLLGAVAEQQWSLEETAYLLELVERHEEDWLKIHELLKKRGYCRHLETEEVILYFLSLPRRGVTQLREEYSDDEFIESNLFKRALTLNDQLTERKLDDSFIFYSTIPAEQLSRLQDKAACQQLPWKQNLRSVLSLQKERVLRRLAMLQDQEDLSKDLSKDLVTLPSKS
jgi:flagellar biosynthesis GTPase FlhF